MYFYWETELSYSSDLKKKTKKEEKMGKSKVQNKVQCSRQMLVIWGGKSTTPKNKNQKGFTRWLKTFRSVHDPLISFSPGHDGRDLVSESGGHETENESGA